MTYIIATLFICNVTFVSLVFSHMNFKLPLSVFCLVFSLAVKAQFNLGFKLSNTIPVIHGADSLRFGWAGGLNNPQFSMTDLDLDGQKDLFVFDLDGALRKGFTYSSLTGHYTWLPYIERYFPHMPWGYCLLRDYDQDGREDIFTNGYNTRGFAVYRNLSDTALRFELVNNRLQYHNPGKGLKDFELNRLSVPIIEDMDADGDLDIIFFTYIPPVDCSTFGLFQNQSQEEYGTSDSLEFTVIDRCWGHIAANGALPGGWRAYDCDTTCNPLDGNRSGRDIAITQSMFDLNGDNRKDLLVSYTHNSRLYALTNTTDNVNAEMDVTTVDITFPSDDIPINLANEPMAYFLDIDQDGATDFITAPNQVNSLNTFEIDTSQNQVIDHFYRNQSMSNVPDFTLEKEGFISGEMIDVGMRSYPAFADLSGDGLPDLVIGNQGFSALGGSQGAHLTYYKNVGTAGSPAFKLITQDLAEVSTLGFGIAHPALADLDGDGDNDLIVGDDQGYLHYFKNKGTPNVYDFHLTEPQFSGIKVANSAHPQFFDMNLDQLPDLVVGNAYGTINYYENSGTTAAADFSPTPSVEKMGNILLYNTLGGEGTPYFSRSIDSTGNLYLFLSSKSGPVVVYGPLTDITGTFTPSDSILVEATGTSITGVNLSGDTRHELVIGLQTGGLYLMNREKDIPAGIAPATGKQHSLELYPNPTNGLVTLRMRHDGVSHARLQVMDITGKVIAEEDAWSANGYFHKNIDLRSCPDGIYLVSFVENGSVHWSRLVKQ